MTSSVQIPATARTLTSGGLSPEIEARLRAQREKLGAGGAFSATLSSGEMLLARESGFLPLGVVTGISFFQIGGQWTTGGWRDSDRRKAMSEGIAFELTASTRALSDARRMATSRMAQEAALLGATGVADVSILRREHHGEHALEFVATGTALRAKTGKPGDRPFLSNLNGDELWKLHHVGWRPVGLVMGNCSYFQQASAATAQILNVGRWTSTGRRNVELPDMTGAVYQARALAMSRMEAESRSLGAEGVIGVQIEIEGAPSEMMVATGATGAGANIPAANAYHFVVLGTAIARHQRSATNIVPVLPL